MALALAMQDVGWQVSGSDTAENFITDHVLSARNLEVRPLGSAIPEGTDLIVYSTAYTKPIHPTAKIVSLAQALADFVKDRTVIAVAGVGGKTTTSAMLATLFRAAGRDAGYYIGTSDIVGLNAPGAAGTDPVYIIEADEYAISKSDSRPKFALLNPNILITTNIQHDHPDIYPDEASTLGTFRTLVESLPQGSTWIACEDDQLTHQLLCDPQGLTLRAKTIRYGKSHPIYQQLSLSVFGDHNKLDGTAAVLAAIESGITMKEAVVAIQSYKGATRRQEKMGEVAGRLLYDDYGHHPHEIESTVSAFKQAFPRNKITLVFESHTYSRTEKLLVEFAKAIALADNCYIMPIFESAREKGQPHSVTPESFAKEVAKYNNNVKALTWDNAAETIAQESREKDLILTMGAGFVYKLHTELRSVLERNSRVQLEKGSPAGERTDLMGLIIQKNIPLAKYTYFKLGGPSDYFVEVKTIVELTTALSYAQDHKLPYFILGSGSNILVTDKGFRGLVIKNKIANITQQDNILTADSGVPVNQLVTYAIAQGLAGLEDFLGLPGTVGGAIFNNAHHMGDLIGNHVVNVKVLEADGKISTLTHKELDFAYDYSRLHNTDEIILSVSFQLTKKDKEELAQKGQFAVARRAKTQPLGSSSSGCIFQNPSSTQSAGYLIDQAGLKGARVGGAVVSDVHANFIVNDGSATSSDVLDLIELIKAKVYQVHGVNLVSEVFVIGEK